MNFSLVLLMWITLFYSFIVICNYFSGIISDVGVVIVVLDQLMFATLPLVAAALVSWFLCVEVPSFDLIVCFNLTYFVYMLFLGRPRAVSAQSMLFRPPNSTTEALANAQRPLLPNFVMFAMYVIPVVISVCMHIAIHHNVLSTSHTRIANFMISFLVPALLMIYCANRQLFAAGCMRDSSLFYNETLPKVLGAANAVMSFALIFCLQSHPMLDEIKSFSAMSNKLAGAALMGVCALVYFAFAIHQFVGAQTALAAEQNYNINVNSDGSAMQVARDLKIIHTASSLCIGAANTLLCLVVGLPDHAVGVSVIGAMSLAEFYMRRDWSAPSKMVLLFIASLYSFLAAASFVKMTLHGITYTFYWNLLDISINQFSAGVVCLVPAAVFLPAVSIVTSSDVEQEADNLSLGQSAAFPDLNKGSGGQGTISNKASSVSSMFFQWTLPVFAVCVAALELMVREQVRVFAHSVKFIC
jgi:hypothetical protein